jgi:hypothetical protein
MYGELRCSTTNFDLGTSWRRVVASRTGRSTCRERAPGVWGLCNRSVHYGAEKNLLPLPGNELRPSSLYPVIIQIIYPCPRIQNLTKSD